MNNCILYVEDALQFLVLYHELNLNKPKPRLQTLDQAKIESLALWSMSSKPFTEKQGRLAMMFVRKYKKCLNSAGFDVLDIITENRFKHPLIKNTVTPKIICVDYRHNRHYIDISFPYDEYLISLIKNYSSEKLVIGSYLRSDSFVWHNNDKRWSAELSIPNAFFAYKFGKKNCFFIDEDFQKYIDKVEEEKEKAQFPEVKFQNGVLTFNFLYEEQKKALQKDFGV